MFELEIKPEFGGKPLSKRGRYREAAHAEVFSMTGRASQTARPVRPLGPLILPALSRSDSHQYQLFERGFVWPLTASDLRQE